MSLRYTTEGGKTVFVSPLLSAKEQGKIVEAAGAEEKCWKEKEKREETERYEAEKKAERREAARWTAEKTKKAAERYVPHFKEAEAVIKRAWERPLTDYIPGWPEVCKKEYYSLPYGHRKAEAKEVSQKRKEYVEQIISYYDIGRKNKRVKQIIPLSKTISNIFKYV